MPSLISLPRELLHEILSQNVLQQQDLLSAALVCKYLRPIAEYYLPRNYTLNLENPNQQAYKLIRRLLSRPDFGREFHSVTAKFRPVSGRLDLHLPRLARWKWEEHEISRLREVCQEWGILQCLEYVILSAINSEALLPIMLCFMPNLWSLTLAVSPDLDIYDIDMDDMVVAKDDISLGIKLPDGYLMTIDQETLGVCWLDSYIALLVCKETEKPFDERSSKNILWPPGLQSLKEYTFIGGEPNVNERDWSVTVINEALAFLPSLENMTINCTRGSKNGFAPGKFFPISSISSPLKRLVIDYSDYDQSDYINIASVTSVLEHLEIDQYDSRPNSTGYGTIEVDDVGYAFLKNNARTLTLEKMKIKDWNDGSSFGELMRPHRLFDEEPGYTVDSREEDY